MKLDSEGSAPNVTVTAGPGCEGANIPMMSLGIQANPGSTTLDQRKRMYLYIKLIHLALLNARLNGGCRAFEQTGLLAHRSSEQIWMENFDAPVGDTVIYKSGPGSRGAVMGKVYEEKILTEDLIKNDNPFSSTFCTDPSVECEERSKINYDYYNFSVFIDTLAKYKTEKAPSAFIFLTLSPRMTEDGHIFRQCMSSSAQQAKWPQVPPEHFTKSSGLISKQCQGLLNAGNFYIDDKQFYEGPSIITAGTPSHGSLMGFLPYIFSQDMARLSVGFLEIADIQTDRDHRSFSPLHNGVECREFHCAWQKKKKGDDYTDAEWAEWEESRK